MKIEYEVFECNQYRDTFYKKREVIDCIEEWLNEEVIEEGGPHFIYDVRDIIKIKKILVDEK